MGRLPVIGITPNFDPGDVEPLLPGKALLFVQPDYATAVAAGGALPVLLPLCPADPAPYFDRLDGLLVTGNEKPLPASLRFGGQLPPLREQNPVRYASDAGWIRGALQRGLPMLCICRGMQVLNEVLGGTLHLQLFPAHQVARHYQLVPEDQTWHPLRVDAGSLLSRLLGAEPVGVNSFHAQGVDQPGTGLVATAHSSDGVIEGLESPAHPFCLGLQFHPEKLIRTDPRFLCIFRALAEAAAAYRRRAGCSQPASA